MFDAPTADAGAGWLKTWLRRAAWGAVALFLYWWLFLPHPYQVMRLGITVLAVSVQGHVAVGNADGQLILWSPGDAEGRWLRTEGKPFHDLLFSHDSKHLLATADHVEEWTSAELWRQITEMAHGYGYGSVRLDRLAKNVYYTTARGELEAKGFDGNYPRWKTCCLDVYGELDLSADGSMLLSSGHEPRLWSTKDGKPGRSLLPYDENLAFRVAMFSRDQTGVFVGGQDGRMRRLPLAEGEASRQTEALPFAIESAVEFEGDWIAYGAAGEAVQLWNWRNGQWKRLEGVVPSSNLARNAGGDLVMGTERGDIEVWGVDGLLKRRWAAWPVAP
jgi:hypothetical protein